MGTYRVYFRDCTRIVGRHDFNANDDQEAVTIADVLCDACSDRCDAFEVWDGDRCVVGRTLPSPRAADVILGDVEEVIMQSGEAIHRSEWFIASSEKLLQRLEEPRASNPPLARSEA
jgi:hypothetical protein